MYAKLVDENGKIITDNDENKGTWKHYLLFYDAIHEEKPANQETSGPEILKEEVEATI